MEVIIPYSPRPLQQDIHNSLRRWNLFVCHRRFGKTVFAINELIKQAMTCKEKSPRFAYLAPLYKQAKQIAWDYLKEYAGVIPGTVFYESELRCDFPNGARIRLYGADNPDSLRGVYLDGVVLDEYADMSPRVFSEILRPALSDRKGMAIFIGSAKGNTSFHSLYNKVKKSNDWLVRVYKASDTDIIDKEELESARDHMDEQEYMQEYECSWEAGAKGAYFMRHIVDARTDGRIGHVAADPLIKKRLFCDIGGTGSKSDAFAIWVVQFVAKEIRVLDYYEAQGQEIGAHLEWMRSNNYTDGNSGIWLPHDGKTHDRVYNISYESAFRSAGYDVVVIPNQGPGAAKSRIETVRRLFPRMWIDEDKCDAGLQALGFYHEKRDEIRQIGLGPDHDWSSHAADAFGYMAVSYKEPGKKLRPAKKYPKLSIA